LYYYLYIYTFVERNFIDLYKKVHYDREYQMCDKGAFL